MTLSPATPYRIVIKELSPDGAIKERVAGDCSAYLVAITADITGELRNPHRPRRPPHPTKKSARQPDRPRQGHHRSRALTQYVAS